MACLLINFCDLHFQQLAFKALEHQTWHFDFKTTPFSLKGWKEGLISTASACATIIQILNNPIIYRYCLVYLSFDLNASCSTYPEMAGLDSSNFEWDFEVAQVTLSIYRQRPLKSVDMRLALSLVKRSGGHPVWNVSIVSTSSTSSTCACSGDQAFLHPPLQKAWMKLKSSQSSGMISFLLYYCTHNVLNESLKTRPWYNHCFVWSCNFLTTWKLMAKSKQYPVTLTTRWLVHFTLGFDIILLP